MYVPGAFRIDDRSALFDFVDSHGFATLVSVVEGALFASHVPLLLDRAEIRLLGHLARANPQWKSFETGQEVLAIFSGPHAYVSPSWYATQPAVPTWNYAVVHIHGVPRLLSAENTGEVIDRLVDHYEKHRPNPWPNELPADFRSKMIAAIVGFEIPVRRIEGKFKLGQNRSAEDQAGMLEGLRRDGPEAESLADFIDEVKGKGK